MRKKENSLELARISGSYSPLFFSPCKQCWHRRAIFEELPVTNHFRFYWGEGLSKVRFTFKKRRNEWIMEGHSSSQSAHLWKERVEGSKGLRICFLVPCKLLLSMTEWESTINISISPSRILWPRLNTLRANVLCPKEMTRGFTPGNQVVLRETRGRRGGGPCLFRREGDSMHAVPTCEGEGGMESTLLATPSPFFLPSSIGWRHSHLDESTFVPSLFRVKS